MSCLVPSDFSAYLDIPNATQRLAESLEVARAINSAGIELRVNLDHAAIFTDPPLLVAGPMKRLGYVSGWDARCYPSPVDGQEYINVSGQLPPDSSRRAEGWPDYIAVVHPVDLPAREHMLRQGYGNPFIHHLTWGVVPPPREGDDLAYSIRLIRFMVEVRSRTRHALSQEPGTLIIALPAPVLMSPSFGKHLADSISPLSAADYQIESMEGGGFLLQFFVLTGGRIELALRVDTKQTFNPKSVHKISRDEISTRQTDLAIEPRSGVRT